MKQHEAWLIKAKNDLNSAKILLEAKNPVLDTAVYHTQQCGEKALKAFLAFNKVPIQKIHDLNALLEMCVEKDKDFEKIEELAQNLSPYATLFRYPDIILDPEVDDVKMALKNAEEVYTFVKSKIHKK